MDPMGPTFALQMSPEQSVSTLFTPWYEGLVIQRLEYFSYTEKVRGSNPFESMKMNKVYYTLLQSKGIGPSIALNICIYLGISPNSSYNSLSPDKLEGLGQIMGFLRRLSSPSVLPSTDFPVGPIDSLLTQFRDRNISKLVDLNTFRGRRHKLGFPVRGQRTRSNARTARRVGGRYNISH